MSTDADVREALFGSFARLGHEVVQHTYFEQTRIVLRRELVVHNMVSLLGPSRVGKGALIRSVVREMNESVAGEPSRLRAAVVRAEVPHRKAFSWKRFWICALRAVGDPLPESKVNRTLPAGGVSRGTGARYRAATEPELSDMFLDAARDRGLEVLFIDEALALLKHERGRVLEDQLDVLRNLADLERIKFVLASTSRILDSLGASEELASRVHHVHFPRYSRDDAKEYKDFRRAARALMDQLPAVSRFTLTGEQMVLLHAGSVGCVGRLVVWFRKAVQLCLDQEGCELRWEHFEATFLPDKQLRHLWRQCLAGEVRTERALSRTFGRGEVWAKRREPDVLSLGPEFELVPPPSAPVNKRVSARLGMPGPSRPAAD